MQAESIRVSVKLEKDCDPQTFLKALEEALGRPVRPARILKSANLLSLWLTGPELAAAAALPGVLLAGPEGRVELPPKPGLSHKLFSEIGI